MNPYSTHKLWPPETLAAYEDMPKGPNGWNAGFTEGNRKAWQDWFRRTPKHLWHPVGMQVYADMDRMKAKAKG